MLFLGLYTPAAPPFPPSPEHMTKVGADAEESIRNGTLISTGPLGCRETGGARVRLAKGNVTVQPGGQIDSTLMRAAGYALIRAASREEAIRRVSEFMAIAGDGEVEILEVPAMPVVQ